MSPAKKPIIETFDFDSVVVEVSMLSNHRDYRIWQAWFGKKGSTQRFWATFKLQNGIWFGPMAYYVVARVVIGDLELVLHGVKPGPRLPDFPQVQNLDVYRERLDALTRTLDIYDQVPYILSEVSHQDRIYGETGTPSASLHNARALLLDKQLPEAISFRPMDELSLELNATWPEENSKGFFEHAFLGFTYGKIVDLTPTIRFFRMTGLYMSEQEFRKVTFVSRPHGPKEWSPYSYKTIFYLGKDYGKEDFQPGEHDL